MRTVGVDQPLYILPFDHDAVNTIAARYRECSDTFEEEARAA